MVPRVPVIQRRVSRRRFFQAAAATVAGAGWYTWRIEPHRLEIVRHRLDIRESAGSWSTGPWCRSATFTWARARMTATCRHVSEGRRSEAGHRRLYRRFISYSPTVFEQVPRVYRHVPMGPIATLAVLGNHDYGSELGPSGNREASRRNRLAPSAYRCFAIRSRRSRGCRSQGWTTGGRARSILPR